MDFGDGLRRTLRRSLSLPRSLLADAAAKKGVPEPMGDASAALAPKQASAMLAARHDVEQPAGGTAGASSHDKSLPNARRSRRASGSCQPPAVGVTPEALAAAPVVISSERGASAPRKARGMCSPGRERPAFGSSLLSHDAGCGGGGGAAYDCVPDVQILGNRKARGECSPMGLRRPAPFEWL